MDINLTTRQLYRLFGDHEVISNSQLLFSSRRSLEPKAVGRNMLYICTCCVVPLTLTSIVRAYQGKWKSEKGSRQHPAQMSGVSPKPTMASRSPRRHLQSGHLYIGGRLQSARARPVKLVLGWMDAALGMFGLCNLLVGKLLGRRLPECCLIPQKGI